MFRALSIAFLLFAGCMSAPKNVPPLDLTGSGWTTRQGQVTWQRKRNAAEISGDLLVAINQNHSSFVRFSKDPFTIVNAQTNPDRWNIDFGDKYYFHGAGHGPSRLIWLHIPEILLASHAPPAGWEMTNTTAQTTLLQNHKSGERVEIFLP
ncbi:MAG: hypothetical protein JWM99_559 [Verrucomicrobiales bacterium]|jgi:hypothetical protein|nr:hypothetical protein [Verrucomicrobiales bacterium]